MTMKSIIFQTFLKYELGCNTKPRAIILHDASMQNIVKKYGSDCSNWTANGVRSPPGKCSSNAITKQFAIIVTSIVYSNGGHSIINFASRRNGWSSENKNNDVGPGGTGGLATWADINSVLTFCREVVVGWADTMAFGVFVCASWAANLEIGHQKKHTHNFIFCLHHT